MEAWGINEVPVDKTNRLPAVVEEVIYKGSTVDLVVSLKNGQHLAVTEFFNEDDSQLIYVRGEHVILTWQEGWEVVLPHG